MTAQTVNRITTRLRPTLLDKLGLVDAIEWEVEEFEDRTGIKCKLTVEPEGMEVDRDRSTAIYRIVQEALTNIARRAQATKSAVSLKMSDGRLHLSIAVIFEINGIKKRGTKIVVIIPIENLG
ncbi:hypothetical protein ES703_96676 [subsurface metagenome]